MTFHNSGLNAPFLHPSVGQPGEEEVPEVEGQLGHHSENANHVDQKPAIIWSATETDHFLKVTWVFLENLDWSGVFLESNQQKPFLATGDVAQVSDRVARAFNQTSYLAKRLH